MVFGGQAAAQFFTYTSSITKAIGSANYILWLRTVKANIRETAENQDRGPSGNNASVQIDNAEFQYRQRGTAKGIARHLDED